MNGGYEPPPGGGVSGPAPSLRTTGAAVIVSGAAPPSAGQVLTATDATHADWKTPGGGGGFPTVVASFNFTGKAHTFSFEILPDTLPTGDYQLNDVFTVVTPDEGANIVLTCDYADETGSAEANSTLAFFISPHGGTSNIGAADLPGVGFSYALASLFHAVTGTPIVYTITVSGETTLTYNVHLTLVRLQ